MTTPTAPLVSIAIDEHDLHPRYMASALRDLWEDAGLQVHVGSRYVAEADVCLLHHNVTRIDARSIPQAAADICVVNGKALDISKRLYSTFAISKGDNWDGPVIVKTNLNHFGEPEHRKKPRLMRKFTELRRRLANHDWQRARTLPYKHYPVLPSQDLVPNWVWSNTDLLVERFLPEQDGDLFCLRGWVFFGSQGYGYRLFATDPLVKTGSMVRYEYLDETPDALHRQRAALGLDFGKIDYVVRDGQATVFDVNKTPTFTGARKTERLTRLAKGIEEFLP